MKSLLIVAVIGVFSISYVRGTTQVPTTVSPQSTTFTPIDFAKARDDIVANIKRQYSQLKNLTQEFRRIFANETKPLQDFYREVTDRVTWYFREPTDNETANLDKCLNNFLPFGGEDNDFVDTNDKMEKFCKEYDHQLDSLKSWLRRRYKSLTIQMSFSMIISKIHQQSNHYCESAASKQDYLTNIQKFKAGNSKVIPAKSALLDAADFIKNATYKIPKIGRLCCAYWDYLKQVNESVQDTKAIEFATNMTSSYFKTMSNYLCVLYPQGNSICNEEEKSPKSDHKYKSIVMQMIFTLSDIVAAK